MRILVTGAAGFIASHIIEELLNATKVTHVLGIDNFQSGKESNLKHNLDNDKFSFLEADIRDADRMFKLSKDYEAIIHHAALISVPLSIDEPVLTEDINVKGTINLLEACRKNNIKSFAYASSSAVYGDCAQTPLNESFNGNMLSPYAISKLANEHYANLYSRLYGISTTGFRYFNVFGERQDPNGAYAAVIPKFIDAQNKGERPIIFGDGEQTRDFIYVKEIAKMNAHVALQEPLEQSIVCNLAYGKGISVNELYKRISEEMNFGENPIYKEERKGDIKHSVANIDEIRKRLLFNPQYDFNQGLKQTIIWFKNQRK